MQKVKLSIFVVLILILSGLMVSGVFYGVNASAEELQWLKSKSAKENATSRLKNNRKIVKKIEDYLSNFTTLKSRFVQTSTGIMQISEGSIAISRPGKARWEYRTPTQQAIVINNGRMSYYDKELNQVSFADIPETPLNILLEKDIDLKRNTKIIDIFEYEKTIHITLAPKKIRNEFENLTMVFTKNPFKLHRLIRVNEKNQSVIMQLTNPKFNVKLDDKQFTIRSAKYIKRNK